MNSFREKKIFYFFIFIFLFGWSFGHNKNVKEVYAQNLSVIINEVMWGSDSDGEEWIELRNMTNHEIDISDWSIDNAKSSNNSLFIKKGKIPSNGYFLICKNNSKKDYCDYYDSISLNNNYKDNGKLVLRDRNGAIIDNTPNPLNSNWPAGKSSFVSMERVIENGQVSDNWRDNNPPTPQGSGVKLKAEAGPSIITLTSKEIILDGSRSKGNIIDYVWNLGDGVVLSGKIISYRYQFPGKYVVSLTVSDGRNKDVDSIELLVFSDSIFLSEFSLKNKWIEIKNNSNFIQDLSGWGISDTKDKIEFIFPDGSFIAPNGYIVLKKDLINSLIDSNGGVIYLFYPNGDIRTQVSYQKFDGSVARKGDDYFYTSYETPGSENIIYNKENIARGGVGESFSSEKDKEEAKTKSENQSSEGERDLSEPKRVGVLSEEKEAKGGKEGNQFLSKNLLSEVKKAKTPLLFGGLGVILFSGSIGTILARLRKNLKSNNQLKKIEVEIEE